MLIGKVRNWLWKFYTWREGNRFSIGVFGAIFDEKGRILLVRQRGREKFGLPGGGVSQRDCSSSDGEVVFGRALMRELKEELGITRFLSIIGGKNFPSSKLKDLAIVYVVRIEDGAYVRALSEIAQIRYVTREGFEAQTLPIVGPRMTRMLEWAFEQMEN